MARQPNSTDAKGMWDVTRPNQQRNAIYGERWPDPFVPVPTGPHVLFTRDDRGGLGASYSGLNNLTGATTIGGWPPMNNGWGFGGGQYADSLGFATQWFALTPNFKINWIYFPCFYTSQSGSFAYEIRICSGLTGDTSARVYETAGVFSPKVDPSGGFERVDLPVTGTTYGTMHLNTGAWYQIMWHTNWNGANSSYASCNRSSHTVTHNGLAQSMSWANPLNVSLWNGYTDLGTTTTYGSHFGFAVTYY
tara:strand:+ start:3658 stop:4404 length:747 start_codon:yes stop_codon:yes gene_type:complete